MSEDTYIEAFEYVKRCVNDMYKEDDIENRIAALAPELQENKDAEAEAAKS